MTPIPPVPDWLTLPNLPTFDIRAPKYGARAGDASVDNIAPINSASVDANAAGGGIVDVPPGLWYVAPTSNTNYIRARSNVALRLAAGATIKVKDNAGNYQAVVWDAGTATTNFAVTGPGGFDQNYAGNTTSSIATGNPLTCLFCLYFTGNGTTGLRVEGVRFDKCVGVNTIVTGRGTRDVVVRGNYFHFKKGATAVTPGYDNTAVYLEAQRVVCTDNRLYSDDYADIPGTAIEIHGQKAVCEHNVADGFGGFGWFVNPFYSTDQEEFTDVRYCNNVGSRLAFGIGVVTLANANNLSPLVRNFKVDDNLFSFKQGTGNHDQTLCFGVDVRPAAGTVIANGSISRNTFDFEADTRSSSTRWSGTPMTNFVGAGVRLNGPVSNTKIEDNLIVRAPWCGLWLGQNSSAYVFDRVQVRRNLLVDCGYNENGTFKSIAEITGVWTDGAIEDNRAIDTATGGTANGSNGWRVYLTSAAVRTTYRGNTKALLGSGSLTDLYLTLTGLVGFPAADRGDASVTLIAGTDAETQRFATALTANRTVTLSSTNIYPGARFRVVRTGLGAFTLDVGGLKTIPSATAAWVDVEHDGSAWRLTGYGTL